MKFILLTLLVSAAFAAPVDNFNDAIENLNQLIPETNDYIIISASSPDQESLDLAAELRDNIPKLEKIHRGLTRDGHEDMAKLIDTNIYLAKKYADDPKFIQNNKSVIRRFVVSVRNFIKLGKRYLDDEDLFVSTSFRQI